jgi:hypothetical protein
MNGYFVLFLIFPPKGMVHLLFGFSFLVLGDVDGFCFTMLCSYL